MSKATVFLYVAEENKEDNDGLNDSRDDEEEYEDESVEKCDDEGGYKDLIDASASGQVMTVQALLNRRNLLGYIDRTTLWGCSALWHAASSGFSEIVRILLEHGANTEIVDDDGKSPLWIACYHRHWSVMRLLIEHGADKHKLCGIDHESILCTAGYSGDISAVTYLVEEGVDMEKADRYGQTPLHHACRCGHLEITRYLLEKGANRDKADIHGLTPLHEATYYGQLDIVKLLMIYGADLNVRTNDGKLPIDMGFRITEEIKQAIRDEPRRRLDEAPGKRAIEDRNAATSQEEDEEEEHSSNKRQLLGENKEEENALPLEEVGVQKDKVAEEDEDSEPSDGEDD